MTSIIFDQGSPAATASAWPTTGSGDVTYSPGAISGLKTTSGDTVVYDDATFGGGPSAGGFIVRAVKAIPVPRGTEEAPIITITYQDSGGTQIEEPTIVAAISEGAYVVCPSSGKIVLNSDLAVRVPYTFVVQRLP